MSNHEINQQRLRNYTRKYSCLFVVLPVAIFLAGGVQAQQTSNDIFADTALVAKAEQFVSAFLAERFSDATADFDSTLAARTAPERMRMIRSSILGSLGPFQEQREAQVITENAVRIVLVPLAFERATLKSRITFNAAGQISSYAFVPDKAAVQWEPPDYANMSEITEREISFGAADEEPLPGLLTLPKGKGPFPAIVLLHGAGPGNRDAGMGATLPFRDLAYGLASRGTVVLRYDKRSFAHPESFADRIYTVEDEVIRDALAAVELLQSVPEVASTHIFMLGHSMGGLLAPRIAGRSSHIAGLILLAAPTRPLPEVIRSQVNYLARQDSSQMPPAQKEIMLRDLARIDALPPEAAADPVHVLGAPAAFWIDLRGYDPAATAQNLERPMLILQGNRDFQATEEDFAGWQRALEQHKNVVLKQYPGLNHLFIEGVGPSTYAEYQRPGHVNAAIVADIAAWIGTQ